MTLPRYSQIQTLITFIVITRSVVARICRPLELIFKNTLESGSFQFEWKKWNVAPIHKKDDKNV